MKLVPTSATATVSVSEGDTVSVPNPPARVQFPPVVWSQERGMPAETVTVSLTPINLSGDSNLMPGWFGGISAGGGAPQSIESFGTMLVDTRDNAGTRFTLTGGMTATIRISIGTHSANPPARVSHWFLDETTGCERKRGLRRYKARLRISMTKGRSGTSAIGTLTLPRNRSSVTDCVKDANGKPVGMPSFGRKGIDYTRVATMLTNHIYFDQDRRSALAEILCLSGRKSRFLRVPSND